MRVIISDTGSGIGQTIFTEQNQIFEKHPLCLFLFATRRRYQRNEDEIRTPPFFFSVSYCDLAKQTK